ncbi:MAG: hypothetical protein MJ193_00075 [Clostridia bacterium]|nr:hypothetical protein [Clostridia bacterium]
MATKKQQSVFFISAIVDFDVDKDVLKNAVELALDRFPVFKTSLKKGAFWYKLIENNAPVKVFELNHELKPILPDETNGYLFKIMYAKNEIGLQIFHGLGDGNSALAFLTAVIERYHTVSGKNVAYALGDKCTDEELADHYKENSIKIKLRDANLKGFLGKAPLLLSGTPAGIKTMQSYSFEYAKVSAEAKKCGATFTSFMVGLIAYSIRQTEKSDNPVVIMVPVNLRKMFGAESIRNFVTFVRLQFHKDINTLEEHIEASTTQLKENATKENMEKLISTTVKSEHSIRNVTLFIKSLTSKIGRLFLKSRQTMIISNLGGITFDKKLEINRIDFMVNVSANAKVNIGLSSTNALVTMCCSKSIKENTLIDNILKNINALGIETSAN